MAEKQKLIPNAEQIRRVQRPGGGGAPGTGDEEPDDQNRIAKEVHPTTCPPGRREGVVSDPDRIPEEP